MIERGFFWTLYAAVGVFFGIAAVVKIADPIAFLSSMLTYEVFSYSVAAVLAYYVPWLEMLVALALVSGVLRKGASFLAGLMLLVFILLVAQGLARGLQMDCGCFGSSELSSARDYLIKIGQNVLLLAALVSAVFVESKLEQKR